MHKKIKNFAQILVMSGLLLAVIAPFAIAKAQGTATIDVLTSVGGSTTPNGTTTYADGTVVTLMATQGDGFSFQYWEIASAAGATIDYNNPTTLTVSDSNSYAVQAVFMPIVGVPGQVVNVTNPTDAIIVILAGIGGTTTPVPGTYALANAGSTTITATPDNGFKFDHWVIGGSPLTGAHGGFSFTDTPTNNPYTVDHGYGNRYSYQPVFTPTTVPEFPAASTVILAIILIAVTAGAATFASKRKQITRIPTVSL